ncbi:hypothetical protein L2E82_02760 [Cichorium intybus]|uniref:Uncharacterized protein n=1 Tax=Cichorium intybus TaxID=13427 RepID=A0ACB9H286_CICIN|nr:hypothetical protein L2E82_02760 [Cichorium intybus]
MSTSSEIVDSGRFSGHKTSDKSNFSQTFSLLSQYLKENGTLGDLSLGMATGTMNLFPAANKSSLHAASPVSTQQVPKKLPESAQMTIFYAGQVIVLDDFPAEKAMEIMMLAGKGTSKNTQTFRRASDWTQKPTEPSNRVASTHTNVDKEGVQLQPVVSDLPIARKASLARFLEKRKERITARSPYQNDNHEIPSKQEDSKAWLGLAAESRGQFPAMS